MFICSFPALYCGITTHHKVNTNYKQTSCFLSSVQLAFQPTAVLTGASLLWILIVLLSTCPCLLLYSVGTHFLLRLKSTFILAMTIKGFFLIPKCNLYQALTFMNYVSNNKNYLHRNLKQ